VFYLGGSILEYIIKKIIESEYRAREIVREAEEQRKQMERYAENFISDLENNILAAVEEKINKYKVEKEKEAVAEIQKIMDTTNQKISLIEKRFEANRELWVRELFDKIIGGD